MKKILFGLFIGAGLACSSVALASAQSALSLGNSIAVTPQSTLHSVIDSNGAWCYVLTGSNGLPVSVSCIASH